MSDRLGILDRLLTFVDRPWKAVALVVLMVVCGTGWVLYEKRDTLLEAWLTPTTPELRTGLMPAALAKLVTETDADLSCRFGRSIWRPTAQWFLGARRHDGERPVIPNPRRLPVIVHSTDVRSVVEVLDGTPACVNLPALSSPLARRLEERGMKRGCIMPIPPSRERSLGRSISPGPRRPTRKPKAWRSARPARSPARWRRIDERNQPRDGA